MTYYQEQWSGIKSAPNAVEIFDTGVDANMLKLIGQASVSVPNDFVSDLPYKKKNTLTQKGIFSS